MEGNGKQVTLAACGSLLLHVLLLLLWAVTVGWFARAKPPAPPPPIHLEVVQAEETPPPPPPPLPTPIPYLDTVNRLMAEQTPEHPQFDSSQDSEAASELPATGDKPLPTLEGKKIPVFAFNTTVFTPGELPAAAAQPPPPSPTEPSPPQPVATPAAPPPTPRPVPVHTPVPDDEFGLATPTPTPEETDPGVDPAAFRSPDSTMPQRPSVASRADNQSNAVGFQATQDLATVSGSITKHGEANVDAAGTPVGRYKNRVINEITKKWIQYFYSRSDLIALGMVHIQVVIDRRGKVLTPRIVSNSANEALADVSLQVLMDASIPPMPPETLAVLPRGELSMDLTFNAE